MGLSSNYASEWTTCHRRYFYHQTWRKKTQCSPTVRWEPCWKSVTKEIPLGGGYITLVWTHRHNSTALSTFYKLSLGPAAAPASSPTLAWSFVSCFYLIIFFHYSAKHIGLGRDTADLSLKPSRSKPGGWNMSRKSIVGGTSYQN